MCYFSVEHYEIFSQETLNGHLLCRGGVNLYTSTPLVRIQPSYLICYHNKTENDTDDQL